VKKSIIRGKGEPKGSSKKISINISEESFLVLQKMKAKTGRSIEWNLERIILRYQKKVSKKNVDQIQNDQAGPARKRSLERVYKLRRKGCTLQEIADELNKQKIPTFSGKGKWHKGTVSLVMKRRGNQK